MRHKNDKGRKLDSAVWNALVKAITNEKLLASHISILANNIEASREMLTRQIEKLNFEKTQIANKKN